MDELELKYKLVVFLMMSTNDTALQSGDTGRDTSARITGQPKPSFRRILTNTSSSGSGG